MQELFPATYDFEANWFSMLNVQAGVTVDANAPPEIAFHTALATLRLLASTGAGLSGQDAALFVRVAGAVAWSFSGYPDGSGTVAQELLAGVYDVDARWFRVDSVQSGIAVAVGAPVTVTFRTKLATLRMLASDGSGLSGHDGALFVRPVGTSTWSSAGAPDASGTVAQELFAATYDVEARWFGAQAVQSSLAVDGPITVTFQATRATLQMLSSTGTGLSGQDESLWVRQSGTSAWYQTDPPGSGVVAQELLPGVYDVRSRWFGVFVQQSNVAVLGPVAVTFTSVPVTLKMLTSSGSGLAGEDEAMWVRSTGTAPYFFLGAPPASGVLVQELFAASYDVKFRWTGSTVVLGSNAVSGPATVSVSAVPVVVNCRRQSDGTAVAGATGSVVHGGVVYPFGASDGSGIVNVQVLVGAHDFRCKLGALQATNTNVTVPAGGTTTTILMS